MTTEELYKILGNDSMRIIKIQNIIDREKKEAQLDFIELLNHNKKRIFIGENRDINHIFLDLKFLRTLVANETSKENK